MTIRDEVYLAALAGLLHDVGKFAQRAGEQGSRIWGQSDEGRETKSEYGYYHALLSADFIDKYVPESWQSMQAVGYHHKPKDDLDYVIQLADWLSASEREEEEDIKVPYLLSPFARLKEHKAQAYLPLKRLEPASRDIFPTKEEPTEWRETYHKLYEELWNDFTAACKKLPSDDLAVYLESLYGLMQEFTWCIPSAYYKAVPDVSLYNHARTTAALAACLVADERDGNWCREVIETLKQQENGGATTHPICLLVGGDISGVQKFIYSIASKNAAKSLRGRSFYLQLLTEAVVSYALAQLKLPITNLLYAGGGNFYLLVPSGAANQLEEIQAQVTRRLFQSHEGSLRLTLAWTPASAREFKAGVFVDAWDRLHQRLRRAKDRPLSELETDEMLEQLGPVSDGDGNQTTCLICGREKGSSADQSCSLCESLGELGRQLAYATHLVIAQRPAPKVPRQRISKWWQGLEQFGVNVWPVDVRRSPSESRYIPGGPDKCNLRVYPLTQSTESQRAEPDLLQQASARGPVVVASRPFAQLVPYTWPKGAKQEQIATFDELAKHSQGIKRWGVLRMDVDDLSKLFRDGFKHQKDGRNDLTLSRLASLSFALRLFFEGYIATIGQPYQEYTAALKPKHQAEQGGHHDKLYVQYAGGDDLFVVGAWDTLPKFATDVRNEFARYVCHNPAVTLSSGITLHPAKFPLYQAADQAGQAEHTAKSFRRQVNDQEVEKDAIAFLGQTLSWDDLAEAQQRQETILRWMNQGAPRAIVQQLRALHQEWLDGQEKARKGGHLRENKFYYGPWIWHAVYQLTRTANSNKKIRAEIKEWEDELVTERGNAFISLLGLAARWADYLTRTREGG